MALDLNLILLEAHLKNITHDIASIQNTKDLPSLAIGVPSKGKFQDVTEV